MLNVNAVVECAISESNNIEAFLIFQCNLTLDERTFSLEVSIEACN